MTKLLNLCPVKKSHDITALRQLYDECEVHIHSLQSLGVASEAYESLLCPVLLQMIPDDITLQYSRQRGTSDEWKVSKVMEFLQKEILSRERTMQLIKSGNSRESQRYQKPVKRQEASFEMKHRKHNMPSAAVLQTTNQRTQNCLFCDSAAHKPELCPETDITACKDKLMKMGGCFVCLGLKHIARFCKTKIAVCEKRKTCTSDTDDNKDNVVSSFASHSVKIQPAKQNTVLLQTIRACAEGPAGRRSIRFFITKRNTVKVTLQNIWKKGQKIEIEALETPQVCTAMMKIPGEHIQAELKRKDNGTHDTELSMLIGVDYYWRIVSGKSLCITMKQTDSPEEEEALLKFEKTTQYKDGRYKSDVVLCYRYNEVVNYYLEQGIVKGVVEEDSSPTAVKYYMPHHTVLRKDKAFFNDCLLTGPNPNPDLLSILIKFRLHAIAFTADIKKSFLQISLAEKDRDAVRFLWLAAPRNEDRGEKLHVLWMTRVVFGVSPSPFLLAATVRKHLKKYETQLPEVVKIIKESLYVDDFISSASDVEKAFSITANAKQIMSTASMDLCKWTTNSPELKEK
ncbi:hypothetical protein M9458_051962 [Cirrhinus mrigala]|uniref:Reverse transcriptase domain-containing protein n=1 Tax=Cirrhinus mrigala TaxID=683832 RepID=A0ABD0MQJ0_CIRMR